MAEGAELSVVGRRCTLRMILIVGAILALEAVLIIGAMKLLGGTASVEAAEPPATLAVPEGQRIEEILVLDARLPNDRTGITYLYDAEIYVQVKRRHAGRVRDELEQFRNEIRAEITAIWRTSDPREFQEPRLQSLSRRVGALLGERFGVDPQRREPIIVKCVIVMGTGFRVDG